MLLTFNTKTQPSSHFQDFTDFIPSLPPKLCSQTNGRDNSELIPVTWGAWSRALLSSLSDLIFFQLSSVTFPFLSITQWTGTKIWEVLGQSKILFYVKLYFCSPRTPSLKRPLTSPIYVRRERFYYFFCVCVFLNNPIVVTNVNPFFLNIYKSIYRPRCLSADH